MFTNKKLLFSYIKNIKTLLHFIQLNTVFGYEYLTKIS
jgi:hypothetical protein